jgi:hypothetical protein
MKKLIDPKLILKTKQSVENLADFAETGRMSIDGVAQSHLASKIDINADQTIIVNTTTSEKSLTVGQKIKLKIIGVKKPQIITGMFEANPENVTVSADNFKEGSGISVMKKLAGPNLLKKVLATEAVSNKSGLIYHLDAAGYSPKKLIQGKSFVEYAAEAGKIENPDMLEAAMIAQTNYNEMLNLTSSFGFKNDMVGLIHMHIYDIIGNPHDLTFISPIKKEILNHIQTHGISYENIEAKWGVNCMEVLLKLGDQ